MFSTKFLLKVIIIIYHHEFIITFIQNIIILFFKTKIFGIKNKFIKYIKDNQILTFLVPLF